MLTGQCPHCQPRYFALDFWKKMLHDKPALIEAIETLEPSMSQRPSNATPESILAGHTAEVKALAQSLRKLVKKTIPEAIVKAYPGWHGIGYRHPESGYFCAIFPQHDGVKLGFERGVLLPDPDQLLEGAGRQVRYVNVNSRRDIREEAIKKLLHAAIYYGRRKSPRRTRSGGVP